MLYVGIKYKPDLFMGYNLVAGGCTALVAGSILGRKTCYQMTGGQLVLSTVDVPNFDCNFTFYDFFADYNTRTVSGIQVVESYGSVVFQTEDQGCILIGFETWTVKLGTSSQGKYDVLFLIKTDSSM